MANIQIQEADQPDTRAKEMNEGSEFFVLDDIGRVLSCRVERCLPDGRYHVEIVGVGGEGAPMIKEMIGEILIVSWEQVRY